MAQIIVDVKGRKIAVKVRPPRDANYKNFHTKTHQLFARLRRELKVLTSEIANSSQQDPVNCPTKTFGLSFGGGQIVSWHPKSSASNVSLPSRNRNVRSMIFKNPQTVSHVTKKAKRIIDEIKNDPYFRYLINHVSSMFYFD